jgi:hypothetical protein
MQVKNVGKAGLQMMRTTKLAHETRNEGLEAILFSGTTAPEPQNGCGSRENEILYPLMPNTLI